MITNNWWFALEREQWENFKWGQLCPGLSHYIHIAISYCDVTKKITEKIICHNSKTFST